MFPVTTIRSRLGPLFASWLESRAQASIREKPALWDWLEWYKERTSSTGCSYGDYLALYNYVRIHKPREVLECGTGLSTVVLAYALMENEREHGLSWRLTSLEENREYYELARKSLPEELAGDSRVRLVLSDIVEDSYELFRGVRYKDVPQAPYDFVFVDGPRKLADPEEKPLTFDFDFIRVVLASDRPVGAMIDTRTSTAYVCSLLFPTHFRYDYVRKLGVVLPATRRDIGDTKSVVARAMARHAFRRPPLRQIINASYQ